MKLRKLTLTAVVVLVLCAGASAKDAPLVMFWPSEQKPFIQFTFGKFKGIGEFNHQTSFETDVTAQNVWGKPISDISFTVHFSDKSGVRIGEGYLQVSRMAPKETVKFKMTFSAVGTPTSMKLIATRVPSELQGAAPAKKVRTTIYSVPAGAHLRVDGQDAGLTPKQVELTVGKHDLEFAKEGYNTGHFPMEVGPDDVSGGSVSFELGGAAYDTVELRDGSVVNGDVMSIDGAQLTVRVGGKIQAIERNSVKRILLTQRDPVPPQQ